MEDLLLYSVSDRYIAYLRKSVPGVYDNKEGTRAHTRKYLGVVFKIDHYNYYIPLSSPKPSDYMIQNNSKKIRKSIIPIERITTLNSKGSLELLGTLRISHMIPVPEIELLHYDLDNESDQQYKTMVQEQMIYIRKKKKKILSNAKLIYKQKKENDLTANYVKTALDFKSLEVKCDEYSK